MCDRAVPVGIRERTLAALGVDDDELFLALGRHEQAAVLEGGEAMRPGSGADVDARRRPFPSRDR